MELLTKPYSKQQKMPPAPRPHLSPSPAICGGGVATQKRPQEGTCAQGGASGGWRVQGLGRKHTEDLRGSKNKAGAEGPELTAGAC